MIDCSLSEQHRPRVSLASMDIEDGGKGLEYNPADSQGFIRINSVRLRANRILRTAAAAALKK